MTTNKDAMIGILILFIAAPLLHVLAEENYYDPDRTYERTAAGNAVDKASLRLLQLCYLDAADKNVITSGLGVFTLLAMYASGASDETKEELYRALGARNYTEMFNYYSAVSKRYSEMDRNVVTLSNKVFVSDKYYLTDQFSDITAKSYKSESERINAQDPVAAANIMNKWSESATRGLIKSPFSGDSFTPDTVLALVNIITFQGKWLTPFNISRTTDEDFHIHNFTTTKKPTMHINDYVPIRWSQELDAVLILLPYKEASFRMIIILPNKIDGLSSMLDKAASSGILTEALAKFDDYGEVEFQMPKFDITSHVDLDELLPRMGISKVFTDSAPGILKGRAVQITKALQKAFIKVDEEGAIAGAVTEAGSRIISGPLSIKVDHPFLFLILHEDIVLFEGTYSQ